MMVFGNKAAEFVKCEENAATPIGPEGCHGEIYDEDGSILLLGVDHTSNTYLHCVEEMLGVPGRMTEETVPRYIIHKDGTRQTRYVRWFDTSVIEDPSEFFGKYEPAFRYHGAILDGKLGNAPVQLCSARKMKEVMALIRERSGGAELLADNTPLPKEYYEAK